MKNLTEEKVCKLAMSPFYVLYLVAAEYVAPAKLSERHIVRSMEYGLAWQTPFSEGIFELLRSHLHEFYAELSADRHAQCQDNLRAELLSVQKILGQVSGPSEMVEDFRTALKNLAVFVAGGGAFRKQLNDPGMQDRVEWIAQLFV